MSPFHESHPGTPKMATTENIVAKKLWSRIGIPSIEDTQNYKTIGISKDHVGHMICEIQSWESCHSGQQVQPQDHFSGVFDAI